MRADGISLDWGGKTHHLGTDCNRPVGDALAVFNAIRRFFSAFVLQ